MGSSDHMRTRSTIMQTKLGRLAAAAIAFATAIGAQCTLTGCAAAGPCGATGADCKCAECEVCRYNADLACVEVKIKDGTPRTEYKGKTYYFCSEDCKRDFLKEPEKYLKKPG